MISYALAGVIAGFSAGFLCGAWWLSSATEEEPCSDYDPDFRIGWED